ncbi:pickpocket protein 28-like [Contarinia nasturtii]|uniref:pickpocket protein 28-like n=1 Tax=Contarinia nasturtii TaxID=265458 RepID=UPI0012D426E5|nr:pickpocket protein 28-like [Contarinia nasturtii]
MYTLWQVLRIFFKEFCKNSNIHGLRYVTEKKLHIIERLVWLISIGVALWYSGSMIQKTYIEWQENPVKISTTDTRSLIETIPFPTLTICPDIKAQKHKLNIASALESLKSQSNLSHINAIRVNALAQVCPYLPGQIELDDDFANESMYNTLRDIAPNLEVFLCRWHFKDCIKNFKPMFTEKGLCFTFNALNSHEIYTDGMIMNMRTVENNQNVSSHWSLQNGYSNPFNDGNYPFQAVLSGRKVYMGLSLLTSKNNVEPQCSGIEQGFKIFLSTPGETLQTSHRYFQIPFLHSNVIKIDPVLTTTTEKLRRFKPHQRECFYGDERQLHFFKMYTQINCKEECLANFTKQECGCVKFSQPRDKSTRICGGAKIECMKEAKWKIQTTNIGKTFEEECNCIPACTFIKYNANCDRTAVDPDSLNHWDVPKDKYLTIVLFAFNVPDINTVKRNELYTYGDFLAVCGGLLGLFTGFSALSFIEIIYFATLHLFWKLRSLKAKNAAAPNHQNASNIAPRQVTNAWI